MADQRLCRVCRVRKPRDDFYTHTNGTPYHDCKECWKAYVRRNRAAKAEQYRLRDNQRVDDPKRKAMRDAYRDTLDPAKKAEYQGRYRRKYPGKYTARNRLNAAVRDGKITKPEACGLCGASGTITAHHPDYSKPFDVEWLCPTCHGREHRLPRDSCQTER